MEDKFTEILTRLAVIESKIDDYKTIKDKAEHADNRSQENKKDIEELQEKIQWISRAIVGALIVGAIGIVFVYLKSGLGIN